MPIRCSAVPGVKVHPERTFRCRLEAFDWNCPQHITPRYTAAELEGRETGLRDRITGLEAANSSLATRLDWTESA